MEKCAADDQLMISLVIVMALATPLLMVLARNAAFPILILCALISLVVLLRSWIICRNGIVPTRKLDVSVWCGLVLLVALALLVYASITIFWAPDRARATETMFVVASTVVASYICITATLAWRGETRWLHWAIVLILVACSLLIISEVKTGSPLREAFGGSTDAFRLNRSAVAGVLFLPLLYLIPSDRPKTALVSTCICFITLAAFNSISESAKVSLLVISVIFLAGFLFNTKRVAWLVVVGILITHAFAPFIAVGLYAALSPERWNAIAAFVPAHPGQYIRLEIFAAFAEQVLQAPLFGHGLQASPSAPKLYEGSDPRIEFALTFTHPHNFSLQVWYELGLVGVALTTSLLALMAKALLDMPSPRLLAATALAGGAWSVAYVSHGAWQHWWWSLLGLIIMLFVGFTRSEQA